MLFATKIISTSIRKTEKQQPIFSCY